MIGAYFETSVRGFLADDVDRILGLLHDAYSMDGFQQQYTAQTRSWSGALPLLRDALDGVLAIRPEAASWRILLEFPLYRLRRRVDLIVLTDDYVVVVELKVGERKFLGTDRRQVEEYALDLRDFHKASAALRLVPCLWCTKAPTQSGYPLIGGANVAPVNELGQGDLGPFLGRLPRTNSGAVRAVREEWSKAAYRPVPSVIQAATTLFAGHDVRELAHADADNLEVTAARVVELVDQAKESGGRYLIFVTGVPGSGKTLAGLQVVHSAVENGEEQEGEIVYLSGNTPLVTVLRESLALDRYRQARHRGEALKKSAARREVRTQVQHIIDFLREYLTKDTERPPDVHAIVFDEAQRAWDRAQGKRKFDRSASEPQLLIEIMNRHDDWCVLIGLIGGGQEINSGEEGVTGWGKALRQLHADELQGWEVFAAGKALTGDSSTGGLSLGELPESVELHADEKLRLTVPLRSYRSPFVADWVAAVLEGDAQAARRIMSDIASYPVLMTRELEEARVWLEQQGRGERRYGLVASSGARRLRAEGLGVSLNATDREKIAYWYLNKPGDVRSSFALEVTANEYTTQGLELDFVGLCWGGDFGWSRRRDAWCHRAFRGNRWTVSRSPERKRYTENSYRVLLTRAREGIVLWVPQGSAEDPTRNPAWYEETTEYLAECGVRQLGRG